MTNENHVFHRRQFGTGLLGSALLAVTAGPAVAQAYLEAQHMAHMPPRPNAGSPVRAAMLVYPNMILLDLAGPQTILKVLGADIHLVGETMTPMPTDIGINVIPTVTFADCPRDWTCCSCQAG